MKMSDRLPPHTFEFEQGALAAQAGRNHNPYVQDIGEHLDWNAGYQWYLDNASESVNVDPLEPTNTQHAARIRPLLKLYQEQTGSEPEHLLSDFLADLAHYCDAENLDLGAALDTAETSYCEEADTSAEGFMFQSFSAYQ